MKDRPSISLSFEMFASLEKPLSMTSKPEETGKSAIKSWTAIRSSIFPGYRISSPFPRSLGSPCRKPACGRFPATAGEARRCACMVEPCALPGSRGQLPSQSRAVILAERRPQTPHPPRRAHGSTNGRDTTASQRLVVSKCALREYDVRHKPCNRPSRILFSASKSVWATQGTTLSRIAPS